MPVGGFTVIPAPAFAGTGSSGDPGKKDSFLDSRIGANDKLEWKKSPPFK